MVYLSETLKRDIDLKLNYIKSNPGAYLKKGNMVETDLRVLTDIHSWFLEHPEERRKLLRSVDSDGTRVKKRSKQGIKQIKEAWYFLSNLDGPVSKNFDMSTLLTVGEKVDPNNISFRNVRVHLNLTQYVPPNPAKVPDLIKELGYELKEMADSNEYHPVELAAYVHLKLAGIQPFLDGNKRTARLFQNRILYEAGLPPATIYSGERELYINNLESALMGEKDGKPALQKAFYELIATKVNTNLDEIIGDLKTSN